MQQPFQELADGNWALTPANGNSNGSVSAIRSVALCLKSDSESPSTTTSEPSVNTTHHPLMLLSEALLASLLVLPGRKMELATKGTYTRPSWNLLAQLNRDGCSWSRFRQSLLIPMEGHSVNMSVDWPRSGFISSGTAYPLAPLVRITSATVSGLLPTQTATEDKDRSQVQILARLDKGGRVARRICSIRGGEIDPCLVVQESPFFAERMMGFPIGHTELKGSETLSFPKSRSSSARRSTKSNP